MSMLLDRQRRSIFQSTRLYLTNLISTWGLAQARQMGLWRNYIQIFPASIFRLSWAAQMKTSHRESLWIVPIALFMIFTSLAEPGAVAAALLHRFTLLPAHSRPRVEPTATATEVRMTPSSQ